MINLQTYKIFSLFLSYPDTKLKNSIDLVMDILKNEKILSENDIMQINKFIFYIKKNDLLYLQETYVSIFDRQKHFSLYLFEHIHGDSKERGMAMIDLNNLYKKSNFEISQQNELPDFIPVFLEYLSLIDKEKASYLIGEIINIITTLHLRLRMIDHPYHIIFSILESLSKIKPDKKIIKKISNDKSFLKTSNYQIDKDWEEKHVF